METMTGTISRLRTRAVLHDTGAPMVELEGVSVLYSGRLALEEVSVRLEAGQQVAVVGPNGAGKSTLFKVIAGVLQPTAGRVRVYGYGPGGHICIAYVPQRNQIDWTFPVSVADVVMMGRIGKIGFLRWPRRRDWEHVHRSLERVGMSDLARRQIGELSGGQQQRVFIARALAQEAELLLLDEPLSGLDAPAQEAIFVILDDLQSQNITTLVAIHDLNLASKHFNLMMLLNRQMIAFGSPERVLTTQTLVRAYGGQMHVLPGENGAVVLADTCCDGEGEVVR